MHHTGVMLGYTDVAGHGRCRETSETSPHYITSNFCKKNGSTWKLSIIKHQKTIQTLFTENTNKEKRNVSKSEKADSMREEPNLIYSIYFDLAGYMTYVSNHHMQFIPTQWV
ncbi:hypothetical protein AAHE18_02G116600 [Arachis hypogaea]